MLEHELVNICQYYKQTGLSNCPIYGYKRYKSSYKYNGMNKYNCKKYFWYEWIILIFIILLLYLNSLYIYI